MANFVSKKKKFFFRICFILSAFHVKASSANATPNESLTSSKLTPNNFSLTSESSLPKSKLNPNFLSFRVERLNFQNNQNLSKTFNLLYFSNDLETRIADLGSLPFTLEKSISPALTPNILEIEQGRILLRNAKDYYSENGKNYSKGLNNSKFSESSNNIVLNNTVSIYLGRSCENALDTMPNLNFFGNSKILANHAHISKRSLNSIYNQTEWNYFPLQLSKSSLNLVSNVSRITNNALINNLDFFPLDRFQFFPILSGSDFSFLLLTSNKSLCLSKYISRTNQFYDSINKFEKNKIVKRKFSLRSLRVPTKRELRDSVVDTIGVFFKFKKWTKTNVQRPLGNLIRNATGNFLLNPPHFSSFQRKFGSIDLTKKFSPSKIKYDLNESIVYRWVYYNKLSFLTGMELKELIGSNKNSDFSYIPLPFHFEVNDFKNTNNLFLKHRSKKEKNLIIGLNSKEVLLGQSLTFLTQTNVAKQPVTEAEIFDLVKSHDKEYLKDRNERACKSIRYFINVSSIQEEITNFRKIFNNTKKLPNFFLGPELLSNLLPSHNIPHSCGYGLGYFNISNRKVYINPTTGLLSIYKDSNNRSFSGNDKTTFYGVQNGKGYYSDKSGIKYYYSHNYEFDFLLSKSNKDFPKSRLNPDSFRKEFYSNPTYLSTKAKSGPWVDVRRNVRHSESVFYPISKNKLDKINREIEIIEVDEY
tara:strand:- start:394 stop:2496 length:2103 start_codon:yes stop_codon:yes gene_type:complete